jgi:hypothetical protein
MLLHNRDFLDAEFPVNIEVKTSNSLITMHNYNYPPVLIRPSLYISAHSNIMIGTFIPDAIALYCN